MPGSKRAASNHVEGSPNAPLLFVNRNPSNYHQSQNDARSIASHVSARYRKWKRNNERHIALDNTTKSILGSRKRRKIDGSAANIAESGDPQGVTTLDPSTETPSPALSIISSEIGSPLLSPQSSSSNVASDFTKLTAKSNHSSKVLGRSTSNFLARTFITGESSDKVAASWSLSGDAAIPRPNLLGYHSLDSFSTYGSDIDLEMKSNIHFYFKVIRPFAANLINEWWWCDSMAEIQSSRTLAYAVAAYSSLFLSGCLRGGPGVVLPPPAEVDQRSRWPNPPWLRLQTICISELNAHLQKNGTVDELCFAAMVFLFRISVLLADGPSARMHAKALKKIGNSIDSNRVSLNTELAVAKVNIISAFVQPQSIVVVKDRPNHTRKQLSHVVELKRQSWHMDEVWHGMRASLASRVLAWQEEEPAARVQERTAAELIRIDSDVERLSKHAQLELQLCYQIALFLSHILHCISFNTAAPRIRRNATLLKEKLSDLNLDVVVVSCPNLLFNLLLCGAIAYHSYIERLWFVANLSTYFPSVRYMEDVRSRIAIFINPLNWVTELVEEVLLEVISLRKVSCDPKQKFVLWKKDISRREAGNRPDTKMPNASTPRPFVADSADFDICAEFD